MDDGARQAELDHLVERRNILVHRQRLLERQRDMLGAETPPSTTIDLDRTTREIELVEGKIRLLSLDPLTVAAAGDVGVWGALSLRVERLERDMRKAMVELFEELAADREERLAWRSSQDQDRHRGQRRYAWGVWAVAAVLALQAAGVAWIIWRLLDGPIVAHW